MTESGRPPSGRAPPGFSMDVESRREMVKLVPAGEVDIATVWQFQSELEELIEAGFTRIVIDLRQLDFIDSAGMHVLLSADARAKREDWQLAIVPGRHAVQRIFEITGAIEDLPFTPVTIGTSNSDSRSSQLPRPNDVELACPARSQPLADPTSHTYPWAR